MVTLRSRLFRDLSSIVPRCSILAILYLTVLSKIFVIREIIVADHSSLCQKCRIVERFTFLEVRFRCRIIVLQTKVMYDKL